MKEKLLNDKIKELIDLGGYGEDYDNFDGHYKKQEKLFKELKVLAMMNDTLKGRMIGMRVGDGQAMYVITRVNKNTVSVKWIDYCDGYCDFHWGERGGTMDIRRAKGMVEFDDKFGN